MLQEELRFSRKLTEKRKPLPSETESDEEISETPAGATEEREGGKDDAPDKYGGLLTSKDNPWRLETAGSRPQPEAASSGVEHGNCSQQNMIPRTLDSIFSCLESSVLSTRRQTGWGQSLGLLENREELETKGGVGLNGPRIEPGDVRES